MRPPPDGCGAFLLLALYGLVGAADLDDWLVIRLELHRFAHDFRIVGAGRRRDGVEHGIGKKVGRGLLDLVGLRRLDPAELERDRVDDGHELLEGETAHELGHRNGFEEKIGRELPLLLVRLQADLENPSSRLGGNVVAHEHGFTDRIHDELVDLGVDGGRVLLHGCRCVASKSFHDDVVDRVHHEALALVVLGRERVSALDEGEQDLAVMDTDELVRRDDLVEIDELHVGELDPLLEDDRARGEIELRSVVAPELGQAEQGAPTIGLVLVPCEQGERGEHFVQLLDRDVPKRDEHRDEL